MMNVENGESHEGVCAVDMDPAISRTKKPQSHWETTKSPTPLSLREIDSKAFLVYLYVITSLPCSGVCNNSTSLFNSI